MKKRIMAILFAAVMVFTLAACGSGGKAASNPPADNTPANDTPATEPSAAPADEGKDAPGEGGLEVLDKFGDLNASDAEFAPNADYDKYTVVEFFLESANAELLITCSAKADDSEFYMEYNFYGDAQMVICDEDGSVFEDKTGFMSNDTPAILEYIKENAVWSAIPTT